MRLREMFPAGHFAAPATERQITSVERALNVQLPPQLHILYKECNGFREPSGNAKYLFGLSEPDVIGSLVSVTTFWWEKVKSLELRLDLDAYVFFGSSSADEFWGIRWSGTPKIIAYQPSMGNDYEDRGADILDLYRADFSLYEIT